MIRVFMTPSPNKVAGTNGIEQVCLNYGKHMPELGFEYVDHPKEAQLIANHAGVGKVIQGLPFVCHTHGIYWSSDYENSPKWQYAANANVINAIRNADQVTVPSAWVAEAFQRDMRFTPHIIGHGVDVSEWQHNRDWTQQKYVLWNKNRTGDVCHVDPVGALARRFPTVRFATTFAPENPTPNVREIGVMPHPEMKVWIQEAMVYLSTTKETFGIGILEALASGVPVLGYNYGGNTEIVQHGVCGYLAEPGNYEDLAQGLDYCIQHRDVLSQNAIEVARQFTWQNACEKVARVYTLALEQQPATASVIVPVYNKSKQQVTAAVQSALNQSYAQLENIVIVDDGSKDENVANEVYENFKDDIRLKYVRQNNQGVANARNNGIFSVTSKYICCLDADDQMHPDMLAKLVPALEIDKSLGVAYSKLSVKYDEDQIRKGQWPNDCSFEKQLEGKNQVPTCCVFRREAWHRVGGYKQRYAPRGCGAEDAEFWLRLGAYGWGIELVSQDALFLYSTGGETSKEDYSEVDWTLWHPWTKDDLHPFASIAKPKFYAHPVRQYDEPQISVIIPVGPGHENDIYNALDSLEAQNFRKWEAIVINDSGNGLDLHAYPYVKLIETEGKQGAGYARNRGVEIARAPFVVFLDADDWLYPEYLNKCIEAWNENESIIYTDYVGKAIISQEHAETLAQAERLHAYNPQTQEAVIAHRSAEYQCELAQRQPEPTGDPNMPFYHWSLVTCLIPTAWHQEIGGFDEQMPTWEDIDYHWRMARVAKYYHRIPEELIVYNFHTGHRREASHKMFPQVIQYIKEKYEREENMPRPCSSCGSKVTQPNTQSFGIFNQPSMAQRLESQSKDADYVWCTYVGRPGNRSDHSIIGPATGTRYGYGHHGARVLVHKSDIYDRQGRRFGPFDEIKETPKPKRVQAQAPKPIKTKATPPKPIVAQEQVELPKIDIVKSERIDLQTIPGVTNGIARQLSDRGIETIDAILDFGVDGLETLKYCDADKAEMIISAVENRYA